jgi:general secretion pathway protein B
MSFILDALRKSETDRQRQSGPGLADAGYRPPARRRTLWLPLLVVVLAANAAMLGLFWLRPASDGAPEANTPVTPPVAPPVAPTASPRASTPGTNATPAVPQTAPATDDDYASTADAPALEDVGAASAETLAVGEAVTESAPVAPPAGAVSDDLPNAEQLIASGELATPPLHLDIHVFSARPAERFVFINMRRYGEGAQLAEGPRVEGITPEGVVLSQNGRRFVLTRD